jgi:hypothetical protein
MRRSLLFVIALLAFAGCGDSDPPPRAAPTAADTPEEGVRALPDAGMAEGHTGGADAALFDRRAVRMRVPEIDRTPPLAVMRLDIGAGEPVVRRSPEGSSGAGPVELARPSLDATALVRDMDGGTGRIRVSAVYTTDCDGRRQLHGDYFPPAQIQNIRVAPGARVPNQRLRSATIDLPADCAASGRVYAEATNAHGLESISDPIQFTWK